MVKGRRREAIVLGSLIVLYWLYMGSQSRFYARWMLPLYPALAILAAYALSLDPPAVVFGVARRARADPVGLPTSATRSCSAARTRAPRPAMAGRQRPGRGRRSRSSRSRRPSGTASRPAAVSKADPRRQWKRYNRSQAMIAELGARLPRRPRPRQLPELRAHADAGAARRLPARRRVLDRQRLDAVRPRAAEPQDRARGAAGCSASCAKRPTSCSRPAPTNGKMPRYQVDTAFNYVDGALEPARAADGRLPASQLQADALPLTGPVRSALSRPCPPALRRRAAAQARVVLVATGTSKVDADRHGNQRLHVGSLDCAGPHPRGRGGAGRRRAGSCRPDADSPCLASHARTVIGGAADAG